MPGIYVQDGGATSSAIGNVLGGLAANMGPEAYARAALLKQQTEAADYANQLEQARVQGLLGIPGTLAATGADPTAGAGAGGTVPGVLAGAAVPPGPAPGTYGSRNITAGFTPYGKVLAGSYAADPSMGNFATGVNLGRTATQGPGSDYATQTEIAKAKALPYVLTPGQERHVPGAPTAGGETVTSGGDVAAVEAEKQQRAADTTDAGNRAALAETASQQLNENQRLQQIYDHLVNAPDTSDLAGVIGDAAVAEIAKLTGAPPGQLSSRMGALLAIQGRLGSGINNKLQAEQAGTPVRGLLQRIEVPDPTKLNPEQFRSALAQYNRVLQYQRDEGPIAGAFQSSDKSKAAGDAYRASLAAHQDAEFKRQQQENAAAGGNPPKSTAPPPAPPPGPLKPASPGQVKEAQDGMLHIPKGFTGPQWRQRIIDHAKQQNIDLEAGGF